MAAAAADAEAAEAEAEVAEAAAAEEWGRPQQTAPSPGGRKKPQRKGQAVRAGLGASPSETMQQATATLAIAHQTVLDSKRDQLSVAAHAHRTRVAGAAADAAGAHAAAAAASAAAASAARVERALASSVAPPPPHAAAAAFAAAAALSVAVPSDFDHAISHAAVARHFPSRIVLPGGAVRRAPAAAAATAPGADGRHGRR